MSDLQQEMEKRKAWFLECQLRRLNLQSFRGVHELISESKEELDNLPFLELVSENQFTLGFPGGQVGKLQPQVGKFTLPRVYLDSQQPVWTVEEREQRDAFADVIGSFGDWLDFKQPKRIAEKIDGLKDKFEKSPFGSIRDNNPDLNLYKRKDALDSPLLSHAISRSYITLQKPWLIPEIYNFLNTDLTDTTDETDTKEKKTGAKKWIENAKEFVTSIENELLQIIGDYPNRTIKFNKDNPGEYKDHVRQLMLQTLSSNPSKFVKVSFLGEQEGKITWDRKILTANYPFKGFEKVESYNNSGIFSYWSKVFDLKGIYLNSQNSDMGLCILMRAIYLFGTLPPTLGTDNQLVWRKRQAPDAQYHDFLKTIAKDDSISNDPEQTEKFREVTSKLTSLLELQTELPRCAALSFSMLNAEFYKQAILGYKFWLDEPFYAYNNHGIEGKEDRDKEQGINKARVDIKNEKGEPWGKPYEEMEYWSENHYIMFASSEFLAGQLWSQETFQPARDFLSPVHDPIFRLTGKERQKRARARVLKWLNNKLLFGWTEFNSAGYYREHMWAVLNLVDFALDEEIKKKAEIVLDLLLFDIVRFQHKGSMGAPGGRSQFKSKHNGWDNALGDVIEIMLGMRRIFLDGNGEIGCCFATTTYEVPDVLLEIGVKPPDRSFIDRSRVSISFEEAPKYGIQYSQKSDQKDSIEQGFKPKRKKHFKVLDEVNEAIRESHNDYGTMEDDTVFWWGMSAYYNKQVVRNTFACVDKFHLKETGVFKGTLPMLISLILPFMRRSGYGLAGGLLAGLPGAVTGVLLDDILGNSDREGSSNELSIFLDGSSRTRANIFTYRNKDVMLSSIQNFRPGQLNYQSNVQQATISGEINVFTTSAFPGFSFSNVPFAVGGALSGFALAGPLRAIGGAVAGIVVNESVLEGENPLGDETDGPSYWTGYWALPMVLQHENAAIIAYDFHWIQNRLTDTGSHAWFPKNAFDSVEQRRTSFYENENFPLFDITDIGPKGFWIFGKKIHLKNFENPQENEEGYIGLFSNQRPEWLNKDSDFYKDKVKEKNEKALEEINDKIQKKLFEIAADDYLRESRFTGSDEYQIVIRVRQFEEIVLCSARRHYRIDIKKDEWERLVKDDLSKANSVNIVKNLPKLVELAGLYMDRENHKRTWARPLPVDFFADKDWSVDGKNIWIMQVGNKKDYGSFENFKDRVSKARIELDDVGTMECIYHIPRPDGSSQALSLEYGGNCKLGGNPFQTDLYPRFENPFVRGGRVEWGQRDYVIEWRGKYLLHQFNDLKNTTRSKSPQILPANLDTILSLVIYIKTEDENMDRFSVAQATIKSGCDTLATDEIVAVGEVDKHTHHDAEFIFLDHPGTLTPDMTIEIKHLAINGGGDDPEWKMSFSLKALMGDHRLYDCALSFTYSHFEDARRSSGAFPFTVQVSRWRKWQFLKEKPILDFWQVALQPSYERHYYNYFDLFTLDKNHNLLHRKVATCPENATEWKVVGGIGTPLSFKEPFSLYTLSTRPLELFVFAINNAKLFYCFSWQGEDINAKQWILLETQSIPSTIFGLPDPPVPVPLSARSQIFAIASTEFQGIVDLYLSGSDGNFYSLTAWYPGIIKYWGKIKTNGVFTPLPKATFQVCANHLFTLDNQSRLWVGELKPDSLNYTPSWVQLTSDSIKVNSFVIAQKGTLITLLVNIDAGEIHAASFVSADQPIAWERVGIAVNFLALPHAKITWAIPREGHLDVFTTGQDGKIYTTYWEAQLGWEGNHNWSLLEPNSQTFTMSPQANLVALNRIKNQLEIFTQAGDQTIWKTWWT